MICSVTGQKEQIQIQKTWVPKLQLAFLGFCPHRWMCLENKVSKWNIFTGVTGKTTHRILPQRSPLLVTNEGFHGQVGPYCGALPCQRPSAGHNPPERHHKDSRGIPVLCLGSTTTDLSLGQAAQGFKGLMVQSLMNPKCPGTIKYKHADSDKEKEKSKVFCVLGGKNLPRFTDSHQHTHRVCFRLLSLHRLKKKNPKYMTLDFYHILSTM